MAWFFKNKNTEEKELILEGNISKRSNPKQNKFQKFIKNNQGILTVLIWYLFFAFIGGVLLFLPIFQKTNDVSFIDSLFISSSAFSDTGLSTVIISESYNFFGQLIILSLILIGGVGWFTIKYFIIEYFFSQKLTIKNQSEIMNEKGGDTNSHAFAVAKVALFSSLTFTLIFGLIFGLLFYLVDPKYSEYSNTIYSDFSDPGLKGNFIKSFWAGIFHSGSSINNAGFDIFGGNSSLGSYYGNYFIQLLTIFLFIFGGVGFAVIYDITKWMKVRSKGQKFRFSIFTKIATIAYFSVAIIGLILVFLIEGFSFWINDSSFYSNVYYGTGFQKSFALVFNTFSTRNAGFSTVNIGDLSSGTKFVYTLMMFIGSGPGSTAGGIRTTTLFILVLTLFVRIKNSLSRGQKNSEVVVFNRRISDENIKSAFKIFIFSFLIVFATSLIVFTSEKYISDANINYLDSLFISSSAYGTTGLATKDLTDIGAISNITLIIVMFIGQFGIFNILNLFETKNKNYSSYSARNQYKIQSSKYLEAKIRLG